MFFKFNKTSSSKKNEKYEFYIRIQYIHFSKQNKKYRHLKIHMERNIYY